MIISWLMIISAISLSGQRVVMSCANDVRHPNGKGKGDISLFWVFLVVQVVSLVQPRHVSLSETIYECLMMRRIVLYRVPGETHTYYWHGK